MLRTTKKCSILQIAVILGRGESGGGLCRNETIEILFEYSGGKNLRKKLKKLRVLTLNISQEEMADRIGVARATYAAIEKGKRRGNPYFWMKLQNAFDIPDAEMYTYMKFDA